jgi:hypothetical protein
VPDRVLADQPLELTGGEDVDDVAHPAMQRELSVVAGGNPRALLAPVLKRV